MKLTVYFYDRKGMSLASPEHLEGFGPKELYTQADDLRDKLVIARHVAVYLHTVEEP